MIYLTRQERLVLIFLAAALAVGAGFRVFRGKMGPAAPAPLKLTWELGTPKPPAVTPAITAATAAVPSTPLKINPNVATAEELAALPGIGPALAQRVVAYRAGHPPFRRAKDLARVSGISARMAAALEPYLIFNPQ